jgi:hypothetical protein
MTHARRGLNALVISLLEAVTWDVEGKEITGNVEGTGKLIGEGVMLVPTLSNLVFRCTTVTIVEATLRTDNTGHGLFTYSGCKVFQNGLENKNCTGSGLLPVSGKLLPILHEGRTYFLVEPLTAGASFTVVHFPPLCALPLSTVKGSYVGECEDGNLKPVDCKEARIVHYIKPAPEALFPGDELKFGLNKVIPHGEGEVFLKGPHEGMAVNALAP